MVQSLYAHLTQITKNQIYLAVFWTLFAVCYTLVGHTTKIWGRAMSNEHASGKQKKISNKEYNQELANLQIELVKLQEWIKEKNLKVVCIFEGRDAAGKGGVIKRITESLNPRICRVVALGTPTEREKTQWYFQRYIPHLPAAGEMVLFDRSWYNRAGVEHVMGFCTDEEYQEFMRTCPEFERMLVRSGIILIKYWFSVNDDVQEERFQGRIKDPTKRWKLSPMDLESRKLWIEYSKAKDQMFAHTDIKQAPVRAHRHQAGAVVRGQRGHQETRPPELHQALAEPDSLRGSDPTANRTRTTRKSGWLCASAVGRPDFRAGASLTDEQSITLWSHQPMSKTICRW
jgi:polyphosphate kinase 2